MTTTLTSSPSTDTLGEHFVRGLVDELEKIAEVRKDPPIKKVLKGAALASLGMAAGTGIAMVGHKILKSVVGAKYESMLPATKLKFIAPAIGIGSTAIVALTMALQREMSKNEKSDE